MPELRCSDWDCEWPLQALLAMICGQVLCVRTSKQRASIFKPSKRIPSWLRARQRYLLIPVANAFLHTTSGAPQELDLHFIQSQAGHFARSRLAIIGYFGLLPKLESTLAAALVLIKQTGCAVAVETGGDGGAMAAMAPALPHIDYYVPSLEEAVHQTGLSDPRLIVDCYRRLGATGLVGVKLGFAARSSARVQASILRFHALHRRARWSIQPALATHFWPVF